MTRNGPFAETDFIEAVEDLLAGTDPGRLERGKRIAASAGYIDDLDFDGETVSTSVAGSRDAWYAVTIHFDRYRDHFGVPHRELNGYCNCPDGAWPCKHLVAVLIAITSGVVPAPPAPELPEGAGETRWAATCYDEGPTAAEAFARNRTELPEPPPVPAESAQQCFHPGQYEPGRFTDEIDADRLDLQAAVAANGAFVVLTAIDRGRGVQTRPDDLLLDAARIAAHTAGLEPELAAITGCSPNEMHDRALAWHWAGAEGIAILTDQWKPEAAVCKAADEDLTILFGRTNRRLNRWTIPSLPGQLRLAEDGRWHPYTKNDNRWSPAGLPTPDLEAAANSLRG